MSGCHWCSHVHSHTNQQQKVATMMDTQHNLWGWGKGEGEINKLEGDLGKTGRLLRFNSYAAALQNGSCGAAKQFTRGEKNQGNATHCALSFVSFLVRFR